MNLCRPAEVCVQRVSKASWTLRSVLQGRLLSWVCLVVQVFLKGKVGRRGVGPASVGFIVDKQVGPLPCGTCSMLGDSAPMHCFTRC